MSLLQVPGKKSLDMTDEELDAALRDASPAELEEFKKSLQAESIITSEEADQLMLGDDQVVKCGLPQHSRPTEPENTTNVYQAITQLANNDPSLTEVNINNMKRTPVPDIQKLVWNMKESMYITKLSLANLGLTDTALLPLIDAVQFNKSLLNLNVETNYLSGDFLVNLLKAVNINQILEQLHMANQAVSISNTSEMEMASIVEQNNSLTKIGFSFRKNEARIKVDQRVYRNNELRRLLRKQENSRSASPSAAKVASKDAPAKPNSNSATAKPAPKSATGAKNTPGSADSKKPAPKSATGAKNTPGSADSKKPAPKSATGAKADSASPAAKPAGAKNTPGKTDSKPAPKVAQKKKMI